MERMKKNLRASYGSVGADGVAGAVGPVPSGFVNDRPITVQGDGDNVDGMDYLKEFMMPGGLGTSKPVVMNKSKPVNTNPFHDAPDACSQCMGVGRGKNGAI
jgi:hypothetical protein